MLFIKLMSNIEIKTLYVIWNTNETKIEFVNWNHCHRCLIDYVENKFVIDVYDRFIRWNFNDMFFFNIHTMSIILNSINQ